jgi:hypothetical protein
MRPAIAAFFVALIAIPVAQVARDARADDSRLYIWNGHLRPYVVTLSKHRHPKAPDDIPAPRLHERQKTG